MQNKYILIVGGAGYIGSHMVNYLRASHYIPIILDNLSTGHKERVGDCKLIVGDMGDTVLLNKIFATYSIDAVMHFASFIEVGQSVTHPAMYYKNNLVHTVNLLLVMVEHKIKKFIFSSSAAVYGEPQYTPIDELHPLAPINPYGHSKRMVEQVLEDFSNAYDFQFSILRYFNAAGADPAGKFSKRHHDKTHLIPLILQAVKDQRKTITIYGQDYATPDGTCIRDYVHVNDICAAHLLALESLNNGQKKCIYNLGTGTGYSVQQVIDIVREVTNMTVQLIYGARRLGDPAVLVANASRARDELEWQPKFPDLKTIIQHAWQTY